MIYLTVMGRCGNQMFQYAFAKRMAEIQKDEITINFGDLHSYTEEHDPSFCDELCNFAASRKYRTIKTRDDLILQYGSVLQKTIYRLYRKIRKIYGRLGINPKKANTQFRLLLSSCGIYLDTGYREKSFGMRRYHGKNLFIRGYFEDPAYFEPIKESIQKDFIPLFPILPDNKTLLEKILSSNSVCVSFRKWEVSGRNSCGKEYYRKAFDYFREKYDDPLFVIFSNDIEWVSKNFSLPDGCLFESGNNPIWEKVRLMSSCKHFIISNSTFAWWVQYLGRDQKKTVVSPAKWFEDETKPDILIMKEFVVL